MTLENEFTLKVSDDTLIVDIENTTQELNAYVMLRDGFRILSNLPENRDDRRMLSFKSQGYESKVGECAKFLDRLKGIAKERGLI